MVATEVRNLSKLVEQAVIDVRMTTERMNEELELVLKVMDRSSRDTTGSLNIMKETVNCFYEVGETASELNETAKAFTSNI